MQNLNQIEMLKPKPTQSKVVHKVGIGQPSNLTKSGSSPSPVFPFGAQITFQFWCRVTHFVSKTNQTSKQQQQQSQCFAVFAILPKKVVLRCNPKYFW